MKKFYDSLKQVKKITSSLSLLSTKDDKIKFCAILQDLVPDYGPECSWLKRILEKDIHLEFIGKENASLSEKKQIVGRVRKRLEIEEGFGEKATKEMISALMIIGDWKESYCNDMLYEVKSSKEENLEKNEEVLKDVKNSHRENKTLSFFRKPWGIVIIGAIIIFAISNIVIPKVHTGDIISFGKNNMQWQVLEVKGNKALLILNTFLDEQQPFSDKETIKTWEECSLRNWLNNDFYNDNFTREERDEIKTSKIENSIKTQERTVSENATEDKIFLLSKEEVEKYFPSEEDRSWNGDWWLRSPGEENDIAVVASNGTITSVPIVAGVGAYAMREDGSCMTILNYTDSSIRPAMWIDLNKF